MTDTFWKELLEDSVAVSNVKIICSDGVIVTHKIVVATASSFIKVLMKKIPDGDDVSIFLPEFCKRDVEEFLSLRNSFKTDRDIFAGTNDNFLGIEQKFCQDFLKTELNEENNSEISHFSKSFKSDDDLKADSFEPSDENTEDIHSDSSKKGRLKVKRFLKKSAYTNAINYYHSGKCKESVNKVAKMFNVSQGTLSTMLKSGESYKGRGNRNKCLTESEENAIVKKVHEKVNNGEPLNHIILRNIVKEEIEFLKMNSPPERDNLDNLIQKDQNLKSFVYNFAVRHNLKKFYPDNLKEPREKKTTDELINKEILDPLINSQSVEELEKELIPNATTAQAKTRNKVILHKIATQNALSDLVNKKCSSINEAAKKYNLNQSTLSQMVKYGSPYKGRGNHKRKYLSDEEEKVIVTRALELVDQGQNFDLAVLKTLLKEEIEIITVNFPERIDLKEFLVDANKISSYLNPFIARHDLRKYFPEDTRQRLFECDVCFKKFTFKNTLVKHQKVVHYSFLS